jgi:RimJ/RimL family protein N-acetyltransferase
MVDLGLDGQRVRLEPLDLDRHFEGLAAIGLDSDLWTWTLNHCETRDDLREYVEQAVREWEEGRSIPFATIDLATGAVAGCTRFGNIDRQNQCVEIGWTWLGRRFQRTHVNTEAKYLMLRHAFEKLGCVRVELKTNVLNERSRRAMLRLGCVEEGVLRKRHRSDRGVWRDTVYYSVLDHEWPAVKQRLEARMSEVPAIG